MNSGERVKESERVQKPQNNGNDDDAIQNRLDGSLHWDESVYRPEENTYNDQNFENLQ